MTENNIQQLVVSPQKAAELLDITRPTIYKLIHEGELQSFKLGRLRKIPIKEIENYMDKNLN